MSKKKLKIECGNKIGEWTLERYIDGGGNGDVWEVSRSGYDTHAIKILRNINQESRKRFKCEIEALSRLKSIEGIIPIVEKDISDKGKDSLYWFVMPLAQNFEEYKQGKSPIDIVRDFMELADTLNALHDENISHRDIKPSNIMYFNNRLCLSDFGLVKYPDRPDITESKRDVGAKYTMAPEMRRNASTSDGKPADVYSFAKSLWIALTGENLGFDGQYNPTSSLALRNYIKNSYTTKLDQLLVHCTDTNPKYRPTISSFKIRISEWLELVNDFNARNLIEWSELTDKLFPLGVPSRATWTQIDAICGVLSEIAQVPSLNHMFYPSSGGNTIIGISRSTEENMIEMYIDKKSVIVLKPSMLTYESFGSDSRWTYFHLDSEEIEPTKFEDSLDYNGYCENLTEITPGNYQSYSCWHNDDYNGETLPATARYIKRYIKGSFVFFSTRSIYNLTPSTYDGRHNKMSGEEFRNYIQESINTIAGKSDSGGKKGG